MIKKHLPFGVLITTALFVQACLSTSYRIAPEELSAPAEGWVVITLKDGTDLALYNLRLENGKLVGVAENKKVCEVDARAVVQVSIKKRDMRPGFMAIPPVIVEILLLIGAATAPSPPPTSSCPFIFSYNGESFVFDAEPYGGAVCRGLERAEWCELEHIKPVNGRYRIGISNLLRETQYTNELKLLVADHPEDVVAACDAQGGVHAFRRPLPASSAVDGRGRDVAALLAEADGDAWRPAYKDRAEEATLSSTDLRGELTIEFPKPRNARSAKLLVKAGTTPWGSHMAKEILELNGAGISDWYAEMNQKGPALYRTLSWFAEEELYLLQIRLETSRGWESRGLIYGAGPFVSEKKAYVLDIRDLSGDSLRLRLAPPLGFWEIDQVVVEYDSEADIMVRELSALQASDRAGADIRELLTVSDDRYYVMPGVGDAAEVVFDAPPVPPGARRTVFLKAAGYYEIHLESNGPRRAELLESFMTTPGAALRFAYGEYLRNGSKQNHEGRGR